METIYLDRLFAINLIIDYFLLLGSAKTAGLSFRRLRYGLAAFFGAAYAALSVFPALAFLTAPLLKLAAGIAMSLIAFGGEERFFRCTLIFFAVSALFGGAIWALTMGNGSSLYLPVSMPALIFSFAILYALLSLLFKRWGKGADRRIAEIVLTYGGKSLSLRALYDSGNDLYDPISGDAVLICSPEAVMPLFPEAERPAAELIERYPGVFRLIPYSAVGTASSLMAAFRPDGLTVDGKEKKGTVAAISPQKLSGEGFDAIIGI